MSALDNHVLLGYCGSRLRMLSATELAYCEGNALLVLNTATGAQRSHSECTMPIGTFAVNAALNMVVVAEKGEEVALRVCSVSDMKVQQRVPSVGHLEAHDMAFSRSNTTFAVLCGLSSFRLSLFSVSPKARLSPLCSVDASAHQAKSLYFSPFNAANMATVGNHKVVFWHHESVQGRLSMSSIDGKVHNQIRISSAAYTATAGELLCGTADGDVYEFNTATGAGQPWWESPAGGGAGSTITALVVSRRHVVAAAQEGMIRFFCTVTRVIERTITLASSRVAHVVAAPSWNTFYVGGADGVVQSVVLHGYERGGLTADAFREIKDTGRVLLDVCGGAHTGVTLVEGEDGRDLVCSVGVDNMLRVWNYKENTLLCKTHCGKDPLCIAAGTGPSRTFVAVGYTEGHLRLFNVADASNTKLVGQVRVTKKQDVPVTRVCASPSGERLAFIAEGLGLFFSRSATELAIAGYVAFEVPLRGLVWVDSVTVMVSGDNAAVQTVQVPEEPETYEDESTRELPQTLVSGLWRVDLPIDLLTLVHTHDDYFHICAATRDRALKLYHLDKNGEQTDPAKVPVKKPVTQWKPKDKQTTACFLSDTTWLVSTSADGRVEVRDINGRPGDKPRHLVSRHGWLQTGIADACMSRDGATLITAGGDGVLGVWSLTATPDPQVKELALRPARVEEAKSGPPLEQEDKTFIEHAEEEIARTLKDQYAWHRKEVADTIAKLREQLQHYKAENASAAPDEKLETQAFMIESQRRDIDEQGLRLLEEKDEEIKWSNLRKEYVADGIKKQCWDSMATHLQVLKGMAEGSTLEVPNYNMLKISTEERMLLRKVKFLREVEILEWSRRPGHESLDDLQATEEEEAEAAGEEVAAAPAAPAADETEGGAEEEEGVLTLAEEGELPVTGLLYNRYSTYSQARTITQIMLLQQEIYVVSRQFNAKINAQLERKKTDIAHIVEKNIRIRQIYKELDMPEKLFIPKRVPSEHPELVLEVTDEEINVAKQDEANKASGGDAKRKGEDDEAYERALKIMMDNRLERDERVVVEIKLPPFADESNKEFYRQREEWTDDEQKAYREYEKKVQKRLDEEDKHRKALQAELKDVQRDVDKMVADYDASLAALFEAKLCTDAEICQTDLKIIKLAQGLVHQEEMAAHAEKLATMVASARVEHHKAALVSREAQAVMLTKRDKCEELAASERRKTGDKEIRLQHPFVENEDHCEVLVKILRKSMKPKKEKKKEAKERKRDESSNPDPFACIEEDEEERKKRAAERPDGAGDVKADKPDGLREEAWRDFLEFRKERLDAERTQRVLTDELQELTKAHERLEQEARAYKNSYDDKVQVLRDFKRQMVRERYNLDTLHVFKQGRIEVEQEAVVTDYADAILIDKTRIKELNAKIREHGQAKVEKMVEIMQFKKGIRYIEWENELLNLEVRSLEMEHKHLHTLRATKAMQEFIKGGAENHHDVERSGLLKKIEHVKTAMQAKIDEKKQQMLKVKRVVNDKDAENRLLEEQVKEARQTVIQREEIHHLQSTGLDHQRNVKLMKDMRVTRKLEDVARAQQDEMKLLKKEIDRLRERTFPSFAVVSKRVVGNPDELQ